MQKLYRAVLSEKPFPQCSWSETGVKVYIFRQRPEAYHQENTGVALGKLCESLEWLSQSRPEPNRSSLERSEMAMHQSSHQPGWVWMILPRRLVDNSHFLPPFSTDRPKFIQLTKCCRLTFWFLFKWTKGCKPWQITKKNTSMVVPTIIRVIWNGWP